MRQGKQLSDLQLAIMRVLWTESEATVAQVHSALTEKRSLAVTTVATVLSRLEKQGLVEHRTEGRQFIYRPLISEQTVRRSMVAELTERLFHGDATALVNHLLSTKEIAPGDLARVKALLETHEQDREKPHDDDQLVE